MEGDGMVAIVQGLEDAGLAVTLMNRTHLQNSLKSNTVPIRKSSVETNTNIERVGRHTAAQVHDSHYTSSYQLAHCNIRPSSPPVRLPEFPLQRSEPSRNQGNFQVGGYGSGEYQFSPISSYYGGGQSYRGGVWPERSPVSGRVSPTSIPPQNTDPFVHSLRRYPLPISPEKSLSTELVQRLLSYTQNKHSLKIKTKSMRHLPEESPTRDQKTDTASTKNIQTYTRGKTEPSRDCGANTSNDIRFSFAKKGRSFSSTSPYNARARSDHNSDTYDYLSGSTRRGRHPEVRYLNDVKKCIRETIKQIYEEKPVVCPQIKSRYTQHQRVHHQKCSKHSCPDAEEAQASVSTSIELPLLASCLPPTAFQTCPKHQICCFCKQPIPCSCGSGASTQELTPEVLPNPTEAHKAAVPQSGVCTCKTGATKENKIADEIFKWLNGLPVYADDTLENKVKREEMVSDLADKLKGMESDGNYELKAKEEINKCIEKLPMWYPGAKRDQKMFKNQMADDLFNRLTSVESTDELKDVIGSWLDEIQFEAGEGIDKNNIVDNFFNRLKPLVDKPDEMKLVIKDMIRELPILNKNKIINKLADKLTNDLTDAAKHKRLSTDSTDEELENQIMDWLEDIPELSSDDKENKIMVKSLAKKIKKAQKQGLDDEKYQEQTNEEVVEWINSILRSKGEKLDSKTKAKLSNKLLDKLTSAATFGLKRHSRKSSLGEQNDYEDQIWDWLEDVVDIPEEMKTSNKKLVKKFAEKLRELESENANDDEVQSEVMDFLESLSNKGVAVSTKDKDKLAKKLINQLKSIPKTRKSLGKEGSIQDENLEQSILSEISDLVEDIPSSISKNKRNEIKDKVTSILAKNINNLSSKNDNINREIVNILKKEAKMPENEASDLASALINRVKGMPLSDQSKSSLSRHSIESDNEINEFVSEEVSDILNDYEISKKMRKEVEKSLTKVLVDQIVRGTENKKTKDNIVSILKNANLSEDDALDISQRLLQKNKELALSYRTQDSKLVISKPRLSRNQSRTMSPLKSEDFEVKAEKEILDFIEDLTSDDSPKARKKRKEAAGELVHKLGEIMSDPDETDKEKSIIEEVSKYLKKLSIDSDMTTEELAQKLANILQGIGFQASTPKKGKYSFYPTKDTSNISSIRIDHNHDSQRFKKPTQVESDEEKEYANELINLIQSWIDELPIDLTATEDKDFKETMIRDLASDIVDRKKYLQLNPDAKTSDEEELEYLKYQVFRWLNKLLDSDDLSSVMQNTEILMRNIKDVNVPELIKATGKRTESKTGKDALTDSTDSINHVIFMWMEEISQKLYTSSDKNFHKQMIDELAEKIQQLRSNNQTENIDKEISNWLGNIIKESEKHEVNKLTESLKARLKQRGFTEASFMLSQDSSQFVEENLIGGIQDWLKSLPLYQKRNSTEKREVEKWIPELVQGLKSVFISAQGSVVDADKLFTDEIIKHLKKFPMDAKQKSDPEFLHRTAAQLLHYLKGLQMFTNISDRRDIPPDEYLKGNLEEWLNSLPISKMNSTETVQFENLKKEFEEKIKRIRQEDPKNEQKLKEEIKSYLLKFPIEENMKHDQTFINDKVEQLFKNLLAVPVGTIVGHGSEQIVTKAVANWVKSLPLEKGKTVDDIPSNAIDNLTSAISNLIAKTNNIEMDEIKKTIENETEKFLTSVPLDPNASYDVKSLADALFKDIKETSRRRSSTVKRPSAKAADVLFDNIESWCDGLPLKGDTLEEIEKAKKVKQEITSKIIHKIGELNMNPEVFNDDFLYDEMLEDEIDNLLSDISSEDIQNNLPAIKKDLMEKVKEARQKTQEEVAGQAYMQQLREAISKTLPSQSLSAEEQVSFEVLKDNLADAFINLHYVGGDEELKNKYKRKINDEVTKFCNDYLKKHPETPIDSKKLNKDLYNALKGVQIPKEETMRNEVELVKIKDEVNDWIKELPLNEQSAVEKIQTNKMVAVLSKKIHDIEKQNEIEPDADCDNKMRKEITKLIKKLPLKIDDAKVTELTDKLLDNLKSTEKSRRVSASARHSVESDSFVIASSDPISCQPTCTGPCKIQYTVPPSNLSFEDRRHLQRLRERSPSPRIRYPPSKDASVSPLPIDVGSQTEIRPWETCQPICGKKLRQQNSGVQTQRPPDQTMQAVGSQAEVSPHVIVREYFWDTAEASKMQGTCAPCPSEFRPPGQFSPGPTAPQTPQTPCSQCPHMSPQTSIPGPCLSQTPTPQPRQPRKEWEHPCRRREMPEISSEDHQEPCTSRTFRTPKSKVTRLGSFDDMGPCSPSRHDWRFPEEDEFWGDKRKLVSEEDDEPFLKERKKEEEKVRCRCRERILTKCTGRKRGTGCHTSCQSNEDVKRCSKCCGIHCPYPSYLYFRK